LKVYLDKELGDEVDLKYIDVSTPDVMDYIDDVTTIVEGRLPFPYLSVNGKPCCWGEEDIKVITEKIKEKLAEAE